MVENQEPARRPEPPTSKKQLAVGQQPINRIEKLKQVLGGIKPLTTVAGQKLHEAHGSPIYFPHGEAALKKMERQGATQAETEAAAELVYRFFNEQVANSRIYKAPSGQAEFPFTSVSVSKVAKDLVQTAEDLPPQSPRVEKIFIFGSFQTTNNGQFTFVEQAEHEYFMAIGTAMDQVAKGQEPKIVEIYNLGSTTSQFGYESPNFGQKTADSKQVFPALGELYSEFVAAHLPSNPEEAKRTHVTLWGHSEGASLAASTAQALIKEGKITRNRQNELPYADVIMVQPAADHKKRGHFRGNLQMRVGFGKDFAIPFVTRPEIRTALFGEELLIAQVAKVLKDKGYQVRMDEEQTRLKKGTISSMQEAMAIGEDFDREMVRPVIIKGSSDTLSFELGFYKKVLAKRVRELARKVRGSKAYPKQNEPGYVRVENRADQPNPIGKDIIQSDNARTFAIRSNHAFPFYRKNELIRKRKSIDPEHERETKVEGRWINAARTFIKLKEQGKIK